MKTNDALKSATNSVLSTLLAMGMTITTMCESHAAISLINGDFQDTTGLTAQGGGWYAGVPAGWTSAAVSGNGYLYSVLDWNSGNLGANLQTLGPIGGSFATIYQSAGLLDSTGTVTLTFNIVNLGHAFNIGAAIYDTSSGTSPTNWAALANASYNAASGWAQTLQALNVAANTPIAVAFWSADPVVVDNVNVVPEPSAFSLLVAGSCLTFVMAARRRRQA